MPAWLTPEVLALVSVLLGGGGLAGLITAWATVRRAKTESEKVKAEYDAKLAEIKSTYDAKLAELESNSQAGFIDDLKDRVSELERRLDALQEINDKLRDTNSELVTERAQLKAELSIREARIVALEEQIAKANAQIERLKDRERFLEHAGLDMVRTLEEVDLIDDQAARSERITMCLNRHLNKNPRQLKTPAKSLTETLEERSEQREKR